MKYTLKEGNEKLLVLIGEDHLSFETDMSVLFIYDFDWNMYLSPWTAGKIFANGNSFSGKADEMIQMILDLNIIQKYEHSYIAGYSLAGLFSLYFCTRINLFDGCISCSGSLWYPNFYSYLKDYPLNCGYVYLSLGDQEKKSRNPVLCEVQEWTEKVYLLLSETCVCQFEMNPGNHFSDVDERIRKGITWMNKMGVDQYE